MEKINKLMDIRKIQPGVQKWLRTSGTNPACKSYYECVTLLCPAPRIVYPYRPLISTKLIFPFFEKFHPVIFFDARGNVKLNKIK